MDGSKITRLQRRIIDASLTIGEVDEDHPAFLHSVLCQLGLPRSRTDKRSFSRTSGGASMLIEAGRRFDGEQWQSMPLPSGARPRLALIHLCSEAVRTQSPVVDVSAGFGPFMQAAGVSISGPSWRTFRQQLTALACSSVTFGWRDDAGLRQEKVDPIKTFSVWTTPFDGQASL